MTAEEATLLGQRVAKTMLDNPHTKELTKYIGLNTLAHLVDRGIGLGGLEVDMVRLAMPPGWRIWRWPAYMRDAGQIGAGWLVRLRPQYRKMKEGEG